MTGTGTFSDPYIIETADDLNDVRLNMSASTYYELGANIDLSAYASWQPIGHYDSQSGAERGFAAHFDGKGYIISNLNLTTASVVWDSFQDGYTGLFGYVQYTADLTHSIQNLTIDGANINLQNLQYPVGGPAFFGTVVGEILWGSDGIFKNVHVKNVNFQFTSSVNYGTNYFYIGLLNGQTTYLYISSCSVQNSYLNINLTGTTTGVISAAGLISLGVEYISSSFVRDTTLILNANNPNAGTSLSGFASSLGDNDVSNIYVLNVSMSSNATSSDVSETFYGGTTVSRIYSSTTYFGANPEKHVPFANTVFDDPLYCYYETRSQQFADPLYGWSTEIISLTNTQMKNSASYIGFDFENIWTQSNNVQDGYPFFRWENLTGSSPPVSYDILTILTPNGGEFYRFGDNITISWDVTQSYELIIQGFTP